MNSTRQKIILFVVTLALIGGTAVALTWLKSHQRLGAPGIKAVPVPGRATMRIELPERVLDYTSTNVPEQEVVLDYLPKDTSFAQRHYTAPDDFQVNANIILMGTDRTSIHRPEFCLPGQGWHVGTETEIQLPINSTPAYELPVMKWIVSNSYQTPDGQKHEVSGIYAFWFVTEGQVTSQFPQMVKSIAFHLLRHGVLQRWAYVNYFSVCAPGQEDATFARMKELIAASVPEFQLPPAAK